MRIERWIAVLALLLAAPAAAQPAEGTVSGSILDAQRGQPIPGARVVLIPDAGGAIPGDAAAFIPGARVAVSGEDGGYRFTGLPAGRYRLHVSRVGYRGSTLGVELRGSADSRVSVSLTVQPIALAPIRAEGEAPQPFGRAGRAADADDAGEARLAAERLRLREHVSTDVHSLSQADVLEAVTLGEADVFRALQRIPGVSTRDDYTAELWTRGAPWDQTRVFFDGVPLFNPLHGVGAFSGVSPNAVGAAWLHPGVLPTSLGGASAGVLDLRTRRATGEGRINGVADLSVVSTGLALDQRVMDGRGGWMVAGRRTYLDALAAGVSLATGGEEAGIPYAFSDVAARVDLRLGESAALEASGLLEDDHIRDDVADFVERVDARWGNTAGRVTLAAPLAGWRTRHTVSLSRYGARVRPLPEEGFTPLPASRNRVSHLALGGEVEPRGGWSGGWELARLAAGYEGPSPVPNPLAEDRPLFSPSRALATGAAWAERRWSPLPRTTLLAGMRIEGGSAVHGGGAVRLAPRLSGRVEVADGITLSAGVGRSWQYTQALLSGGLEIGSFQASYLWLLAGERVPAVRSDVATAGVEAWFGDGWIADLDVYARRSAGVAVPRPEPGLTAGEPLFAVATNDARGMEVSVRRLVGRWTVSGGYTLARSELRADGYRWPAPEDRRHTVDLTTMVRALPSLRVGAALTAATGASFTRRFSSETVINEDGVLVENIRTGPPGEGRTPEYLGLDLLLDWTRRFRRWDLGVYLQLRNALGRPNAARYSGSVSCAEISQGCSPPERVTDHFERGIPRFPLIGFRARF
ncbi:MAG TPA: TonB-dependent receptor [Longimicrobium sp.]|nr:TonB-dependent receptor [Longimicrobium sp.]